MPALSCNPVDLVRASKCMQCMTGDASKATGLGLLCQWANNPVTPEYPSFLLQDEGYLLQDEGRLIIE